MSYLTQNEVANNRAMLDRLAQAAVQEGYNGDADKWSYTMRRTWASAPGWDAAWESAKVSHPDDPEYDPGKDEGVVTDGMILSQVQLMLTPLPPT
jgi:hypothetical protein